MSELPGPSILAIEDDRSNALILEEVLHFAKIEPGKIKLVDNIDDAKTILEGEEVELILLDPNLGREYAVGFIESLKQPDSPFCHIPIWVLTAEGPEIQQACINAGAEVVIPKPYDFNSLSLRISERKLHA